MNTNNDVTLEVGNTLHVSQCAKLSNPFFSGEQFVLVAGGSGFVGSHLISSLVSQKYRVLSVQRQGLPRPSVLANLAIDSNSLFNLIGCDLADGGFDLLKNISTQSLVGCTAIINCIGIKCEGKGFNTMEGAHLEVTRKLLELSKTLINVHYTHDSVVCARKHERSKYHDTKATAESMAQESNVPYTIIRPSVIFGRGDDMISNLVEGVRVSPFFPLPGFGTGIHQPVSVLDVADSIVSCLNNDNSKQKTYEVVGPDRMTVKEMVNIVSLGLDLPTYALPFPLILHRVVAELMPVIFSNPPITPSQLTMLSEGMAGDTTPIRQDLKNPNLCLRTLSPELVSQLDITIPHQIPFSTRIITSSQHYKRLGSLADYFHRALLMACLGIFLSFIGSQSSLKFLYCVPFSALVVIAPPLKWYRRLIAHNGTILNEVVVGCFAGAVQAWLLWFFSVKIILRNVDNLLFLVIDNFIWLSGILFPFVARFECGANKGLGFIGPSLVALFWSFAMCLVSEHVEWTAMLFRFVVGLMNCLMVVRFEGLLPSLASGLVLLLMSR
eukprot:TRINITY_DN6398_c0_g1_i1.p1 TRINITY_DN6398_c0_g1~~TRINITY_DN6398_c0_g1_i1.p1  ORF type:complete len:553 (-),score=64.72 TRINITY_DN6398_c0_g1_i1:118-1776(-)